MGTKLDAKRRQNMREDTHPIRSTIKRARELIFEGGYNIASAGIKRILDPKSLLPTRVSSLWFISLSHFLMCHDRARFPNASQNLVLISTRSSCQI